MLRAIFGGTFDPIHQGHLTAAADLIKELGDVTVHLMPNAVPPHRPQPQANGHYAIFSKFRLHFKLTQIKWTHASAR